MFKFAAKPNADIVLFFDVNSDEIWDYHVRVSLQVAFFAKTVRPDYHEYICDIEYAYGEVVEFKIPIKPMNNPTTIKFQAASWSPKTNNMSDNMIKFNWINYSIKS